MNFYESFETLEFASFSIVWKYINDRMKIIRIFLSRPLKSSDLVMKNQFDNLKRRENNLISKVANSIIEFLNGKQVEFDLDLISLESCSEFQKNVLLTESKIPRGKISTYKILARKIGSPNASRAVGNALANNPFPIIIPCHRVIKSNFRIGNYQGGRSMKRMLLILENIQFSAKNKVHQKHLWS